MKSWIAYSLLSMLFAGMTAVVAKAGLKDISSDAAVLIRTVLVLGIVFVQYLAFHRLGELSQVPGRALAWLGVSALTTALSWIFYYRAVQAGPVSQVALIDKASILVTLALAVLFLKEPLTPKMWLGGGLMLIGLLILIWK
ncbi:EamA family transporter [Siphonobacter aquaeclarae]|uniref:Transporter family protein n=1 Tax=Siphonobacter aquaeclarae TaxID=563176 RepID=A0A1G9PZ50_9BACT|nr:EamA family transporter [Siphonobacter aquaeclarae]SDM04102.1 transporter family protein [Siphonobacter aquaeclarae]